MTFQLSPEAVEVDAGAGRLLLTRIRLAFALAAMVLAGVTAVWSWQSWQSAKRHEFEYFSTLAEITSSFLDGYFADRERRMERGAAELLALQDQPRLLTAALDRLVDDDPEILFVTAATPQGTLLATNSGLHLRRDVDLATVPGWLKAREEVVQGKGLSIGRPVEATVTRAWVMPLRLGLRDSSGHLKIILNCGLPLAGQQRFWQNLHLPLGGSLGLLRDDAYLVSRYPAPESSKLNEIYGTPRTGVLPRFLRDHASPVQGIMVGYNSVTQSENLFAFHRLEHFPLTVFVSAPVASVKSDWALQFGPQLLLAAASVLIGWFLYRSIVRRYENALRFHQSSVEASRKLSQAASVFQSASEGILITDPSGSILDVNEAFTSITGYARHEVLGKNPSLLSSGGQDRDFYAELWKNLLTQGVWKGEVRNRRKSGESYVENLTISAVRNDAGQVQHYVGLFHDITSIKEHQRQLEHLAHFDALTQLPNRTLLSDRLEQAMANAVRHGKFLAVIYMDLDGFKAINDSYGHAAGDLLLVKLAGLLKGLTREGDTVARLGGDEFVLVMQDLDGEESCLPFLERLLKNISGKIWLDDIEVETTASLGVVFYPQAEKVDPDQLLRQADQAMYQAKGTGKNRFHLFDADSDRKIRGRHQTIERIAQGLVQGEFVLHFQPKVNLRSGAVLGMEALVRWQHPESGCVMPQGFLPQIEDHDVIVRLGDWVIETALKQMDDWLQAGMRMPVSVNVAALQIQHADFFSKLQAAQERHPAVRGDLELEVLETATLRDIVQASSLIKACQQAGVAVALDDFGTGYSSLTYLKNLPAQTIKIDQSFVRDMLEDADDMAILDGIVGLADAFHRQVIAEGVESWDHARMLVRMGCDCAQGYVIARPMPADEVGPWLSAWQTSDRRLDEARVSRAQLPILFAMTEHRAWIRALHKWLDGLPTEPQGWDHHECRFGRWLDQSASRYGAHGIWARVVELHEKVHREASRLRAWHLAGEIVRAQEGFRQLGIEALRDELIDLLEKLLDR